VTNKQDGGRLVLWFDALFETSSSDVVEHLLEGFRLTGALRALHHRNAGLVMAAPHFGACKSP
jgi:hypothetical protein